MLINKIMKMTRPGLLRWSLAALLLGLISAQAMLLGPGKAYACYGPKIFIGVAADPGEQAFYEMVSLYVKEKTGVDTVAVPLEGDSPLEALRKNRVDMAFVYGEPAEFTPLVAAVGTPLLVSDRRPLEDLQFTTVPRALRRLDGLLSPEILQGLVEQVKGGEPPAAAARALLMRHRWI
ncbi:hypothetical protein [Geoalkalibacter halelectricus]|uniref:hypothetical protein n=1 Tax=Geoalkalibacter halelectricus TaxID=2847045 RepID=UPI003D1A2811